MIGLDTNVLVRYLMQNDPAQSALATQLIESLTTKDPGYLTIVSVIALAWVLSGSYRLSRDQLAQAFETLLRTKELVIDRADQVARALRVFKSSSADFADCMIERGASTAGCGLTMTFDVGAAKVAGMTLIR